MKNISLTVSPYLTGVMPMSPPPPPGMAALKPNSSVSFSAQFDNDMEALDFASFIIAQIHAFKDNKDA